MLLLAFALAANAQQAPDELFVRYYTLIQQADALAERKQDRAAMDNYLRARDGLQQMRKAYPKWNVKVVDFRLDYVNEKLKPLRAKFPAGPVGKGEDKPFPPATVIKGNEAIASQIGALNNEIIRLQARNKQLLQDIAGAKATANPAELKQAKQQIDRLEKEKAGLNASLSANQAKLATMIDKAVVDQVQKELEAANAKAASMVAPEAHQKVQAELTANQKRLAEQGEALAKLGEENEELKGRVDELAKKSPDARLRSENRGLKKQMAELTRKVAAISKIEAKNETLTQRVDVLTEENKGLKASLKEEQKKFSDFAKASQNNDEAKMIARLSKDNESLDARLDALVKNEIPALEAENDALKKQVRALDKSSSGMARLERENAGLKEENGELKAAAGELEDALKAEQKMLAKLTKDSDNESLVRDLAKANGRLQQQTAALAESNAANDKLNAENSSLRDVLKRDQRQMAKMVDAAVLNDVRRELEDLKKDRSKAPADAALEKELSDSQNEIKRKDAAISALRKENEKLEKLLSDPESEVDSKKLKELEKQLADAEKAGRKSEESASKLAEENAALKQARSELEKQLKDAELADNAKAAAKRVASLEKDLAKVSADRDSLEQQRKALEDERDALAKQARDAAKDNPFEDELKALESRQQATEAKLGKLERDNARLAKRNADLEENLAEARPSSRRADAKLTAKVEELEDERDALQRDLRAATRQLNDRKARRDAEKVSEMADELANLRARLEVLDVAEVPFTKEEEALFDRKPVATTELTPAAEPGRKVRRELPAEAGKLVAEAQRSFNAGRYDDAEKKYQEVLKMDDGNVFTLANLAATQIEQNRLRDAEANLTKALAADAENAHALYQMGYLKYRQQKLDEALDYLSKAAVAEPKNSDIHNYLGIVLSEKGQRGAAETHLRKAIQIEPGNASAHHNLAVIYATQKPPLPELARWHYEKAREAGHPENAELERVINQK